MSAKKKRKRREEEEPVKQLDEKNLSRIKNVIKR
jgi:hypothetical protein